MKKARRNQFQCLFTLMMMNLLAIPIAAQGTAFTYQGKLADNGNPANGTYDFQFKLFDSVTVGTGTQQGGIVTVPSVSVTNGIFTASLDFGVCAGCFNGAARFLEIAVRPTSSGTFTTLGPRQPITSTPYAIKSLNAATADGLSVACVNCVTSSQIQSVSGSSINGTIPVASVPAGSNNYIQNTTSPQVAADFNISGNGTAGGTLSANLLNATTQFNLGGNRIVSNAGTNNLFVGVQAGAINSTGADNAFFGAQAGQNSTGSANSFFGVVAGFNNTGNDNSFFGRSAGFSNTEGFSNSFFGVQAGRDNSIAARNSFFGRAAGRSNTGVDNSYFGAFAGQAISSGSENSFFGVSAGFNNTGSSNSFFGKDAGFNNTSNDNSFFGYLTGYSNTMGTYNSFFGRAAGGSNTTGFANDFFGYQAGVANTTGHENSFFGALAGASNTDGEFNAFFGTQAGYVNTRGINNAFFGYQAGLANKEGGGNAFFGYLAGRLNTDGAGNAFFGTLAGISNTTGTSNTAIGEFADVNSDNLDHATAIGAGTVVFASNTVQIGRRSIDKVAIGAFDMPSTSTHVCINGLGVFTACSSSLRYKYNVQPFTQGLKLIQRLRPITFNWKESGLPDIGLGAEEVAAVDEQFIFRNAKGQIEGVKYSQLSALFINAFKEQQTQIEKQQQRINQQQEQIDALRKLICQSHPQAEICQ